jgi:hypothetical protein
MHDKHYYSRIFLQREIESGGPVIGVDFGGVIIDESLSERRIDKKHNAIHDMDICMEGAFEGVKKLVELAHGRLWIVSKANNLRQKRTLDWLSKVNFYTKTGLKKDNVIFCRKRKDKVNICLDLNINYFIDNKEHVIQLLHEQIPYLFLFGEGDRKTYRTIGSLITPVLDWEECVSSLINAVDTMKKHMVDIK